MSNAAAEVADDPGTRAIPRTEKPTIGTSLDQNSMICVRASGRRTESTTSLSTVKQTGAGTPRNAL